MVELRWCSPQSLLGVLVLSLLMQSSRMLVSAQGVPYDCKVGFDNWWIGWSNTKKDYCCRHEQRGCQYDCKAALKNWQAAWSEEKKQWCCRFEQLGCGAREPSTHTWTTTRNRGAATGVELLSAASGLDWIKPFGFQQDLPTQTMTTTKTTTIVMQTTTSTHTTTTTSYDCANGIAYYHENWSPEKSEYCCTKHNKGCRIDSCTVGLRSMRSAWSANKTERCCGRWLEQGRWPPFTKTQCCRSTGIGCPATQTTSTPAKFVPAVFAFDCDVGYKNWEDEWSVGKQAYCCLHRSRGCSPTKAATTTELEITTTTEPQTIMTTTALKLDCSAGVDNWEHGWSTFKQDYCCSTEGFPCRLEGNNTKTKDSVSELGEGSNTVADLMHETTHVRRAKSTEIAVSDTEPYDCAVEHYDCTEDIATWRTSWGVAKRRWCCIHDRDWCPTHGSANTTSAVSTPKSLTAPSWSKTKRDWCCKHKQKGCASKDHNRPLARVLEGVGMKVDQLRSEQQQLTSSTDTRRMWTASLLGLAAGGAALSLGLAGRARLRALTHRDIGLLPTGEEPEE